MSAQYVVPGVTEADLAFLRDLSGRGSTPERLLDTTRVRRLWVERYVERRWSPRDGWVVCLTVRGRDLLREFEE
jgi:hypothetical protein